MPEHEGVDSDQVPGPGADEQGVVDGGRRKKELVVGAGDAVEHEDRHKQGLVAPEGFDPGAGGHEPGSASQCIKGHQHDGGVLHPKLDEVERMGPERASGGDKRVGSARNPPKGERQQDFGAARGQVNDGEQEADRAQVAG